MGEIQDPSAAVTGGEETDFVNYSRSDRNDPELDSVLDDRISISSQIPLQDQDPHRSKQPVIITDAEKVGYSNESFSFCRNLDTSVLLVIVKTRVDVRTRVKTLVNFLNTGLSRKYSGFLRQMVILSSLTRFAGTPQKKSVGSIQHQVMHVIAEQVFLDLTIRNGIPQLKPPDPEQLSSRSRPIMARAGHLRPPVKFDLLIVAHLDRSVSMSFVNAEIALHRLSKLVRVECQNFSKSLT